MDRGDEGQVLGGQVCDLEERGRGVVVVVVVVEVRGCGGGVE